MKLIFYKTASDLSAFATFSWRIEKDLYFTTLGNIVFHKTAKFRKGFTFNKYQAHDGIAWVWLRSFTAWKVSKCRLILVRIFPYSDCLRTRITPNTDSFTQWHCLMFEKWKRKVDCCFHSSSWRRNLPKGYEIYKFCSEKVYHGQSCL